MKILASSCALVLLAAATVAAARDLVSIPVVDHFPLHVDKESLKRNGAMLSFKYVMAVPKGLGKGSAEGWESTEVEATIDCKEETYSLGAIAIYPEPLAQGALRQTVAAPAEQRRFDIRPRSTAGYLAEFLCKDSGRSARPMRIEIDDLSRPAIHALLNEHLQSMYELSPPESVHALDLEKLRQPGITFWSAWDDTLLLGCGALKELDATHGEVKSMRTPTALRRRGAGRAILAHIVAVARSRHYERLSLETGSMEAFRPAQSLYESVGFVRCGPFADYTDDPNSAFMTLRL